VVVTGIGAVSAAGVGVQALWQALLEGRTCIDVFERVGSAGADLGVAAAVKDWDATKHIAPQKRPRRMARVTQFAVVAAQEALADAGFRPEDLTGRRAAVIVGSAVSTVREVELLVREMDSIEPRGVMSGSMAGQNFQATSIAVGELLRVPTANVISLTNNCSSGVDAIGQAVDLIRSGRYDLVVAGGAEAPLTAVVCSAIRASGLTNKRNQPLEASRPFDRERESGVLGEGAGMAVLEAASLAEERGARSYAEVCGVHSCPDEQRDQPSSGLEVTMQGALANAGCDVRQIDYISAWGCGDPLLDRYETEAIKHVFGADAYRVAVGSIKGVTGIPLGAAGALQLVSLAMSHRHNLLPPTVNWRHGDLDCDLDYVGGQPRRVKLRRTVLNAHGLSGGNISLVLASPE
jgi:3-oxoacyl-(acyl-carrier-protein) synthase